MVKQPSVHSLHIPVMGTGFTIDTALKVARYGISSAMSVDDNLMEKMREHYCPLFGEAYVPIPKKSPDARARRITEYLDFVGRTVERQIEDIRASAFEPGTELTKYFELLDDRSPLKAAYRAMLTSSEPAERDSRGALLRERVVPGSVDINILTKLDCLHPHNGQNPPREDSDALSAIRGFAASSREAAVVFSAGVNLHLFSYVATFDDFFADEKGHIKKRIVIKVSDYRSALTQGRMFAKKGIWVSEYRIESGLNCGGHAFATEGHLMGPVLEEFKARRGEFIEQLFETYRAAALEKRGRACDAPLPVRITAQGGIGTHAENRFLIEHYELDGTGWGTPFLLVPEATSVDDDTLQRLLNAAESDVYLSQTSPMGVPIYQLRGTASERARYARIRAGRPGSPCLNGYMCFNNEFKELPPLCLASAIYQNRKIAQLKTKGLPETEYEREFEKVVEKACVCHDLGDGALAKYGLSYPGYTPVPAVCPGPNIVYFKKLSSFREMVDHIYGRGQVLADGFKRPHVFINELKLYVQYLGDQVSKALPDLSKQQIERFSEFRDNLVTGIEYYRKLASQFAEDSEQARARFVADLERLREELEALVRSRQAAFALCAVPVSSAGA